MGRKTSSNPRHYRRTFRFTAEELLMLMDAAQAAGLGLSDYVRAASLRGRGQVHPVVKARKKTVDPGRELQWRRVGVNLNQIAHRLNAQDLPAPPELKEALTEIRALINAERIEQGAE